MMSNIIWYIEKRELLMKHIYRLCIIFLALTLLFSCSKKEQIQINNDTIIDNSVIQEITIDETNSALDSFFTQYSVSPNERLLERIKSGNENPDDILKEMLDKKDKEGVFIVLDNGANPDIIYKGRPLLESSITAGVKTLSLTLINKGANLDYVNENGKDYFDMAIEEEHKKEIVDYSIVYALLENNSMKSKIMNNASKLPLLIQNWTYETPLLLDTIFTNNPPYTEDDCALLCAIEETNVDAVKYFLSKDLKINEMYLDPNTKEYIAPKDFCAEQLSIYKMLDVIDTKDQEAIDRLEEISSILHNY